MNENWQVTKIDTNAVKQLEKEMGIDEFIARLLCARGISSIDEASDYLNPQLSYLYSPFLLRDMDAAVARIRLAVERKEKVGIFSDSDLDGLTSLALLVSLLEKLKVDYTCRYPVENEKYGISNSIVDEFHDFDASLLFLLDSGIRDIDEIEYARSAGMDVIVCDHHQPDEALPDSIIVNPCRNDCQYPFSELAGVGVTFKLCHAVLLSYTGNYTIPFVLIADNNGKVDATEMLRGVVTRKWKDITVDELIEYLENGYEKIHFFYHDISDDVLKQLISRYSEYNFFNVKELYTSIQCKNGSILPEKLIKRNRKLYSSKIDYIESLVKEMQVEHSEKISTHIRESLPLVALGTIADLMPLRGENRILVKHGLDYFKNMTHEGISMLIKDLNKTVSSRVVGWDIAPLLNTPGRFGKTHLTADFLISRDVLKVRENLFSIKELNKYRKELIIDLYNRFMSEIMNGDIDISGSIVYIESETCPEGLTGLLANRIADDLQKPVIVVSMLPGVTVVKGSGRANSDIDFFSMLEPFSSKFVKIGGHAQAFGFTADRRSIRDVISCIQASVPQSKNGIKEWNVDCEIGINEVSLKMLDKMSIFEPFGVKNEPFVFLSRNCTVTDVQFIGKGKKHVKCHFREAENVDALGWNMADRLKIETIINNTVDIIYNIEMNEFNGRVNPQIIIRDMYIPTKINPERNN